MRRRNVAKRSAYFHTLMGQFEYWMLVMMEEAFRRNMNNWPMTYFDGLNAIGLYLYHPTYSPFYELPWYAKEREFPDWRQDNADRVAKELKQEWRKEK
jgi:hypothetical protein